MKASDAARELAGKIQAGEMPADEPVFVLRARDRFAASLVRIWVRLAERSGTPQAKVTEASLIADAMEEWLTKQTPGVPRSRSTRPAASGEVVGKNGKARGKAA